MIIAVSAQGTSESSEVDSRFGRAAHLLLYDTGAGLWRRLDVSPAAQGAGVQAAETVCRAGAAALITGHVGPKAFEVLSAGGVKAYQGDGRSVLQAVEDFKAGRLAGISGH